MWMPSIQQRRVAGPIPVSSEGVRPVADPLVYHVPVLLRETVAALGAGPGRLVVDGTLGGGGHTAALLETGATVIAFDRDPDALAHCAERFRGFGDRLRLAHGNFRDIAGLLSGLAPEGVDGLLLDLGVSSWQLDQSERGFSFRADGPLDMRMDPTSGAPASDLVNGLEADALAQLFRELGEEPAARRIAAGIVRRREAAPIRTTGELAAAVEAVVPRHGRIHPATRVFQALRMAVNDESGALAAALSAAPGVLRPGGRLAVITFHSLEDRAVKVFLRETCAETIDRPEWPAPRPNPRHWFRPVTRRAVEPSPEEVQQNPRARSARLRAAERIS
jgi:16S rRNA (cytosine1402-N4)-methyltransferase